MEAEDGLGNEAIPAEAIPRKEEAAAPPAPAEEPSAAPDYITEAVVLLLEGNSAGFAALARARRLLPDALADAVNDALYDVLGDVALEEGEGGWQIVPDYLEDITQWMTK